MIPGKKARNKRNEIAAARVPSDPFVIPSTKKLETYQSDSPWKPQGLIDLSSAMDF